MPELPEVETIRRALELKLPGKRIANLLIREPRLRWPVDAVKLEQLVAGQIIKSIDRRAKYLLIRFERESTLIIHLGMSGSLLFLTESRAFDKHDHIVFYFENDSELRFRDPRRFGMVDAIAPGMEAVYPRLAHLGVEPLAPNTSPDNLYEKARFLKRPIKNLLMDARYIVGVGNIYANEALYYAGIDPRTPTGSLGRKQWAYLLSHIQTVLKNAIDQGGTTLNDFVNSNGETGYFQLSLAVYGREGEPCLQCGQAIKKIAMGGRSSFFCPECQALLKK